MHKHSPMHFGREDFPASHEALRGNLKPNLARAFGANATGNRNLANALPWCSSTDLKGRANPDTCGGLPSAHSRPDGTRYGSISATAAGRSRSRRHSTIL